MYAGGLTVEAAGVPDISFCPGRVDAEKGARETSADLPFRAYYPDPLVAARDNIKEHTSANIIFTNVHRKQNNCHAACPNTEKHTIATEQAQLQQALS